MILKPVVESLPAIVLELVLLGAHSQRVLTSAPSSGKLFLKKVSSSGRITDCNDVCTESFIFKRSCRSCLLLIFYIFLSVTDFPNLHQHFWICDRGWTLRGVGRWWMAGKQRLGFKRIAGHFHHLEYIAAKKSWMAGSTAEGGQSVIKSVANLTTLNIP